MGAFCGFPCRRFVPRLSLIWPPKQDSVHQPTRNKKPTTTTPTTNFGSFDPACRQIHTYLFHYLLVRSLSREEVERRQGQRERVACVPLDKQNSRPKVKETTRDKGRHGFSLSFSTRPQSTEHVATVVVSGLRARPHSKLSYYRHLKTVPDRSGWTWNDERFAKQRVER